jgi:predicted PurR-regulated permease PerM
MNLVLIPVVTFYLLRDWDAMVEGIRTLVPRKIEPVISGLAREIEEVLGAFMRGQLMVMLALGLIYAVGLWLVGLDLAFIIGMIAGLLSIVPYLGTAVGVIAAVIAALFQFQDVFHTVMVLVVFAAGQSLEGMVLTPRLVGDRVGLHPVAVIFAVLAGGQLFGFLGILLALPVASALNVLVRHLHQRYTSSSMYNDNSGVDGNGSVTEIPPAPGAD